MLARGANSVDIFLGIGLQLQHTLAPEQKTGRSNMCTVFILACRQIFGWVMGVGFWLSNFFSQPGIFRCLSLGLFVATMWGQCWFSGFPIAKLWRWDQIDANPICNMFVMLIELTNLNVTPLQLSSQGYTQWTCIHPMFNCMSMYYMKYILYM